MNWPDHVHHVGGRVVNLSELSAGMRLDPLRVPDRVPAEPTVPSGTTDTDTAAPLIQTTDSRPDEGEIR